MLLEFQWELSNGVLNALLDAFENPVYANTGNTALLAGTNSVHMTKCVVYMEAHKSDANGVAHRHFHVALAGDRSFYFAPIKRALLDRSGLATHWSSSHDGYWSAVRYGCRASPSKAVAALDPAPLLWSAHGEHSPLDEACEEPTTAAALRQRRQQQVQAAREQGKEAPRPSEIDVWPLVVRHNIRNTPDTPEAHLQLIQVAKRCCSAEMVNFLFKMRRRLPALIDDVWLWEEIDDVVELSRQTRLQALLTAAMSKQCVCEGMWPAFVEASLKGNCIDPCALAHDMYANLHHGRCESVRTVTLAGLQGGEGKSMLLAPLGPLLGEEYVQEGLATGSFPMLGLENKKAVILNEWRFNNAVLPLTTQLVWLEGKAVPIARPQNTDAHYGHCKYRGSAPIFITTPLKRMAPLIQEAEAAIRDGRTSELTMLMRRLRVYLFTRKTAPPSKQIMPCAACFAQFVLEGEAQWCQRVGSESGFPLAPVPPHPPPPPVPPTPSPPHPPPLP